jgi:hypothetical protein
MYRGLRKRINLGLLAVLEEREELRQEELRYRERVAAMVRARQYRGMTMRSACRRREQ